jgi:hypothetical protein
LTANANHSVLEISLALFNIAGGNFLGLNAAGTAAVPNQGTGVLLNDAPSTTLGSAVRTLPCFINGSGQVGPVRSPKQRWRHHLHAGLLFEPRL